MQQPQLMPIFPVLLKLNQLLMHNILFIFERVSRGYLERLNQSYVEKVMTILLKLRIVVKADENLDGNSI